MSASCATYLGILPFGSGGPALKYRLDPEARAAGGLGSAADYLSTDLAKRPPQAEHRVRFMVQRRNDELATPLDQATVEWPEAKSPSVHAATLVLPSGRRFPRTRRIRPIARLRHLSRSARTGSDCPVEPRGRDPRWQELPGPLHGRRPAGGPDLMGARRPHCPGAGAPDALGIFVRLHLGRCRAALLRPAHLVGRDGGPPGLGAAGDAARAVDPLSSHIPVEVGVFPAVGLVWAECREVSI